MVKIPIDRSLRVNHDYSRGLLVERLSRVERAKDSTDEENNNNLLNKYLDRVSISEIGEELSRFYRSLEKRNNQQALEGFKQVVIDFAQDADRSATLNFLDMINKLEADHIQAYENLFLLANQLYTANYNTRAWLNTLGRLRVAEQKKLLELTARIMEVEEQQLRWELFESLLIALNRDFDINREEDLIKQFLTELQGQSDLRGVKDLIEDF